MITSDDVMHRFMVNFEQHHRQDAADTHGKMLFKLATAYRKRSDISAQGDGECKQ